MNNNLEELHVCNTKLHECTDTKNDGMTDDDAELADATITKQVQRTTDETHTME